MSIKASSITLLDFFTTDDVSLVKYSSSKLLIPAFQRNYAWDTKHVKELIDSLNDSSGSNYYIGNILIQEGTGSNSKDLVIDGQQRLTTLFLLVKVLYGSLNKRHKKEADSILFYDIKNVKARIEFNRSNLNDSFMAIMNNNFDIDVFNDSNSKKFIKNYSFIKEELEKIDDLDIFFEKIKNILFVVIRFTDGYDINELFEGLNSKGKILSTVQLTKNALFGGKQDELNNELIINIWEDIEKNFEKHNVIWFDKFLRHSGFYKYGYVSSKTLFKNIKSDLNKLDDDFLNFSNDLKTDAILYTNIRTSNLLKTDVSKKLSLSDWNVVQSLLLSLSNSELDQVYSVLFSIIKYAKNDLPYARGRNSNFLLDLKKIWAFSILVKYLDTKPSLYERLFANFCHFLSEKDLTHRSEFFTFLKKIISNSSKDKFILNFNNRIKITGEADKKVNSKNNRNYVSQLLLFYLEDGKKFTIEDLGIEHIIPKGKKNGLEKWTNISPEFKKEISEISRYKLGNLTLLSNDNTGNEDFDTKLLSYNIDTYKKNRNLKQYQKYFNSTNPKVAVEKRGVEVAGSIFDLLTNIINS